MSELRGHVNQIGHYPSIVVPIVFDAEKYYAIYESHLDGDVRAPAREEWRRAFIAHPEGTINGAAEYNESTSRMFALTQDVVFVYTTTDRASFVRRMFDEFALSTTAPFVAFELAQDAGLDDLRELAAAQCQSRLEA
jgi:hypothetical protein